MSARTPWTRDKRLVAFHLYCQTPFGKMHQHNPEIIKYAERIGKTPSSLAMKLSNIASLDPEITSTGRKGLAGASHADKAMWEEMQADWACFAVEAQQAASTCGAVAADDTASETMADYTGENKTVLVAARIGQAFFRRAVLSAYNYRCCITGLSVPKLLVASHIVPWRINTENRLNPRNGLCLSMLHDKAFDLGILTIAEDMTVQVSRQNISNTDSFCQSALLAYHGKPICLPEKFLPITEFLAYHREYVFEQ